MSLFGSRDSDQSGAETVEKLLVDAASDYAQHNSAETRAEVCEQSGQTRTNGNSAGGVRWGR